MHIDVTLAGYTSAWVFVGSKHFNAWAETKPWIREGGICVIRTGSSDYNDPLFHSIDRVVRGIHGDLGRLDVRRIECGGLQGSPFSALLSALEIDAKLGPFEARESILSSLLGRPTVFVFVEQESVNAADWDIIVNIVEHYRKASNSVCICAIVLDSRGVVYSEPMCDFRIGRATHQVLAEAAGVEDTAHWPAYLHQRIYWEAGGNLGYALSVSNQIKEVRIGDDDHVEECFQSHTIECMSHQSSFGELTELITIDTKLSAANQQRAEILRSNLLFGQLLWRPPGMQSLRVVPWAARALLSQPTWPAHQIWTLRHSLVCAPLAAEILALCLQFESYIRVKLHGRASLDAFPDRETITENYKRFKNGNDDYVVYPKNHPAPPCDLDDILAFASLGETLRACPKNAVPDLYWSTVRLRNSIAHGHYVGWHQVKIVLKQLRHFDVV